MKVLTLVFVIAMAAAVWLGVQTWFGFWEDHWEQNPPHQMPPWLALIVGIGIGYCLKRPRA